MCVAISLLPGAELTLDEIEKMHKSNADGVGLAWAETSAKVVRWYKTTKVNLNTIHHMINHHVNKPRLVHFRYATAGGTKTELCHPFEIGPLASCKPTGAAAKVMIHNGHWGSWDDVLKLMAKEGLLPDRGPWSDSRLAALLAYHDEDWLEALGGRVAILDGLGQFTHRGDWTQHRDGVKVSNTSWNSTYSYKRGGYTGSRSWQGWGWDDSDWAEYEANQEQRRLAAIENYRKEQEREQAEKAKDGVEIRRKRPEPSGGTRHNNGVVTAQRGYGTTSQEPRALGNGGSSEDPCQLGTKSCELRNEQLAAIPSSYGSYAAYNQVWDGAGDGAFNAQGNWAWTNPTSGRLFEVGENGKVVEVISTSPSAAAERVALSSRTRTE